MLIAAAALLAPPSAAETPDLRARIDAAVAPYLAARDFMGVVGVQRDGEEALVAAYGLSVVELDVPHRADGAFMIGSVSKQFTAVAILLLEEDGKLATGDPVSKHLPDFAHGERITLEQLLTHTSGVPDIYSLPRFGRSNETTCRIPGQTAGKNAC